MIVWIKRFSLKNLTLIFLIFAGLLASPIGTLGLAIVGPAVCGYSNQKKMQCADFVYASFESKYAKNVTMLASWTVLLAGLGLAWMLCGVVIVILTPVLLILLIIRLMAELPIRV